MSRPDPERAALRLLKQQADDGVPGAAAEYADALRRRRKDDELAKRREQAAREKAAGEVSRARGIVGATHPDWYADAVLAWVASPPGTPCPPEIEAEYQRYQQED